MSANKLSVNYAISYTSSTYTITWASVYSPVSFSATDSTITSAPSNSNWILVGSDNELTTLDWRKCTSPVGASRTDLITQLNDLNVPLETVSSDIVPATPDTYKLGHNDSWWDHTYTN